METVKEGKILVEVYRKEELPPPEEAEQERIRAIERYEATLQKLQKKKQRFEELGFKAQAKIVATEIKKLEQEAISKSNFNPEALGYHRITSDEMRIWIGWLPREYREDEFEDYQFDQIPETALTEYEAAKTLGLFETFTLRTPELQRVQDPILIGWFNKIPYLISRWGESLRPFSEIKSLFARSLRREKRVNLLIGSGLLALGITAFTFLISCIFIAINYKDKVNELNDSFLFLIILSCIGLVVSSVAGFTIFDSNPPLFNHQKFLNKYRLPARVRNE